MKALLENIRNFRQKAKAIGGIDVMETDSVGNKKIASMDITRIYIGFENIIGYELEQKLRKDFNIQMELSNRYGVLGVTSIANTAQDFDKLLGALDRISGDMKGRKIKQLRGPAFKNGPAFENIEQVFTPREALYRDRQKIPFEKSQGYVSREYIIPYPPGIPLIMPGERINDEIIQKVIYVINNGGKILGLNDSSCRWIEVIKN